MNTSTYEPTSRGAAYAPLHAQYLVGLPYKPAYRTAKACRMRDCHAVAVVGAYCAYHDKLFEDAAREACEEGHGALAPWRGWSA